MRRLPRHLAVTVGGLCALAALAGCSQGAQADTAHASSSVSDSVPITVNSQPITIGVIVSLTSPPGQGADWAPAAEGGQVAAYRLNQGGSKVTLAVADDKGTADGARTAVQTLSAKGVSGIVLATTGSHVSGALQEGQKDGLPMVMPYGCPTNSRAKNLWCTGTTAKSSGQAIQAALTSKKAHTPLVIDIGGGVPDGLSDAQILHVNPAIQMADLLTLVDPRLLGSDAIVVSGAASQLAQVVSALEGAGISQPVILSEAATSPAFISAASSAGASMSGQLLTVGTNTGDAAALQAGDDGTALSGYLAAIRSAAADTREKSLFGDQPFSAVAASADVASHDAVIALANAAAKAGSSDPAKVASAMSGMKLSHSDGLAGPALNFGSSDALAASSVVPLQASTDNPGLRPQTATASEQLCWIAVPH